MRIINQRNTATFALCACVSIGAAVPFGGRLALFRTPGTLTGPASLPLRSGQFVERSKCAPGVASQSLETGYQVSMRSKLRTLKRFATFSNAPKRCTNRSSPELNEEFFDAESGSFTTNREFSHEAPEDFFDVEEFPNTLADTQDQNLKAISGSKNGVTGTNGKGALGAAVATVTAAKTIRLGFHEYELVNPACTQSTPEGFHLITQANTKTVYSAKTYAELLTEIQEDMLSVLQGVAENVTYVGLRFGWAQQLISYACNYCTEKNLDEYASDQLANFVKHKIRVKIGSRVADCLDPIIWKLVNSLVQTGLFATRNSHMAASAATGQLVKFAQAAAVKKVKQYNQFFGRFRIWPKKPGTVKVESHCDLKAPGNKSPKSDGPVDWDLL